MIGNRISNVASTLALAAGLVAAGPASAVINFGASGDNLLNGEFQQMTFGTLGTVNVVPLLYVLGETDPANQAVLTIPELEFNYSVSGIGTSVVKVTYTVTDIGDEFTDPFDDLRLMVSTRAKGDPGGLDVASPNGFGAAPTPTDPAQFQIFDALATDPILQIRTANALNGSNACGAGCLPDMALQWNRASIGPGEAWSVSFLLVDNPSLVAGGRYLNSTSLAPSAQQFIVGNPLLVPEPGTYAMLFAGLGVLVLARHRRRPPV